MTALAPVASHPVAGLRVLHPPTPLRVACGKVARVKRQGYIVIASVEDPEAREQVSYFRAEVPSYLRAWYIENPAVTAVAKSPPPICASLIGQATAVTAEALSPGVASGVQDLCRILASLAQPSATLQPASVRRITSHKC